jgi:hypothetical protein
MEREYIVVVKKGINVADVDTQMAAAAGDASIPSRPCECANELNHNSRKTHWMLTDEEATALMNDERILSVELPISDNDMIDSSPTARQSGTFDKTNTASGLNWGMNRCSSATNNFPDGTTTVTEEYLYALDGTGIDVVIMDTGIQADHPEWNDANGVSRLKQIDWFASSGGTISGTQGAQHYTDTDGHGTFCAGIVAGKTYGWAKNADIYSIKIFDTDKFTESEAIDLVTAWHNNKGTGRPTVVNMSYGFSFNVDPIGARAGDSGSYYNDNTSAIETWTFGDANFDTSTNVSYRTNYSHIAKPDARSSSVDASLDLMVDAGIHVVIAAGNNFSVQYNIGENHFDDTFTRVGFGNDVHYHRGSSPRTTDDGDEIVVGNISNALRENNEQPANSSSRGTAIDMWAPGTFITSSTANTNTFGTTDTYPDNVNFKIANSTGTSFAAPQVAGFAAMYLQAYPTLTPAQLKQRMQADAKAGVLHDATEAEYNAVDKYQYVFEGALFDAPNAMMFNPFVGDALVKWS